MADVIGDKPSQPQQTTSIYATPQIFREELPSRYRCCCCPSVSEGVQFIGIVQMFLWSMAFISTCIIYTSYHISEVGKSFFIPVSIVTIIFLIAQIISLSLVFYCESRNDHRYILPNVIYNGIGLVCIVIGIILGIVIIAKSGTYASELCNRVYTTYCDSFSIDFYQTAIRVYGIVVIIFLAVSLAFSIWFFVIVLRCYQYVRANHCLQHHPPATVTMPGYQMQYVTPQSGVAYSPQSGMGYAQQVGTTYTPASNMAFSQQSNMGYNPQSNNTAFAPAGQPDA